MAEMAWTASVAAAEKVAERCLSLEEKSKFDRSGKARTNERKYPYIVELSVPLTGLDIQLSRHIATFHKSRHIQVLYGRIVVRDGENYYRWCFSDLSLACAFLQQFGGELCKRRLSITA